MEVKTNNLHCGVGQPEIDEWKRLYKGVSLITVKKDDDDGNPKEYHGYFRRPDLKILSAAGTFADTDPIKSGEVMFANCWLKGDQEMKDDDELRMSAIIKLNGIFKIHEAEVKNL